MSRRDRGAFRLLVAVLALFVFGTWLSTEAKADTVNDYAFRNATALCALLSQDDSDAGIDTIITILKSHGVTDYQAGEVLGLAVKNVCPRYISRVLDWATPSAPVYRASEKVGGALGA